MTAFPRSYRYVTYSIAGFLTFTAILLLLTSAYFNAFVLYLMLTAALFLCSNLRAGTHAGKTLHVLMWLLLIVTVLEVLALFYFRVSVLEADNLPRYTWDRTSFWRDAPVTGYGAEPGSRVRAKKSLDGNLVYDTEYTFDAAGLRDTRSNNNTDCAFVFFGGEQVFGAGLPDIQTLPYQFSRKLNYNYKVLNLGFHGYGPHQMLRILETGSFGITATGMAMVFYILSPDAMQRIQGELERFPRGPKYVLQEDAPIYVGDLSGIGGLFNSGKDFKHGIVSLLRQSQLLNILFKFAGYNGSGTDESHLALLQGILRESARLVADKYGSKLMLLINPENTDSRNVASLIVNENIELVAIPDLLSGELGDDYYLADGISFNEKFTSEVATALANRYGSCR